MEVQMQDGRKLKNVLMALFAAALLFFLFSLGRFSLRGNLVGGEGKIALINISGVIVSAGETIEKIKEYRDDDSVAALLIRIDSPGGGASPSQEIYGELMKIREEGKKKIVASIGSLGASGGYYVASPADMIFANPGSLTGSIGVIIQFSYLMDLFEKIGLETEVIKSGPYKDTPSAFRKMSPEDRKLLQGVIDDVHSQFIEAVSRGRNMEFDEVVPLADGRILTGAQAMELGLVDELGGLEDAIEAAARLAGIEGKPQVIRPKKKWSWLSFLDSLTGSLEGTLPLGEPPGLMYIWLP
jgi:protease-4